MCRLCQNEICHKIVWIFVCFVKLLLVLVEGFSESLCFCHNVIPGTLQDNIGSNYPVRCRVNFFEDIVFRDSYGVSNMLIYHHTYPRFLHLPPLLHFYHFLAKICIYMFAWGSDPTSVTWEGMVLHASAWYCMHQHGQLRYAWLYGRMNWGSFPLAPSSFWNYRVLSCH